MLVVDATDTRNDDEDNGRRYRDKQERCDLPREALRPVGDEAPERGHLAPAFSALGEMRDHFLALRWRELVIEVRGEPLGADVRWFRDHGRWFSTPLERSRFRSCP